MENPEEEKKDIIKEAEDLLKQKKIQKQEGSTQKSDVVDLFEGELSDETLLNIWTILSDDKCPDCGGPSDSDNMVFTQIGFLDFSIPEPLFLEFVDHLNEAARKIVERHERENPGDKN